MNNRVYNFAAGPSIMPEKVLLKVQNELYNYNNTGMSVMEMSHRSAVYAEIFNTTKQNLIDILNIPSNYEVLFLQGGASSQFAMVPLNLIGKTGKADYILTGNFSTKAYQQAKEYGDCRIVYDTKDLNHTYIPEQSALKLNEDASYVHYCANNTIYGTEWQYVPETAGIDLVCDMSSNILSKPIDVAKYGLIYAGAQKNMAPAGLTVVIIRKDLLGNALEKTPIMFNYATHANADSMYNTPPCYCIYILGEVLKWLKDDIGGLENMALINSAKAKIIYDYLDSSKLFIPKANKQYRSKMNATFSTGNKELDELFVKEAADAGLVNIKGHKLTGGLRASIYNAMPKQGVSALVEFMKKFEMKNL